MVKTNKYYSYKIDFMTGNDPYQLSLFPDLDLTSSKSEALTKLERNRKAMIMNLDLYIPSKFEGLEQMPKIEPYISSVPNNFVTYDERDSYPADYGICFYSDDYKIRRGWSHPTETMSKLKARKSPVIAPDFSVFTDLSRAVNVSQLFLNRWTTSYWQSNGIPVIPSASWGSADSFSYCFDGLPENSIISIGHIAIGKTKSEKELYRLGVKELIDRKKPLKLIVYGFPLGFSVDTELIYVKSFIQRKFRKR